MNIGKIKRGSLDYDETASFMRNNPYMDCNTINGVNYCTSGSKTNLYILS